MEYNFWFFNETEKVSLALHKRGSHQKVAVVGSMLASDEINAAGEAIVAYINENNIEARPLKSVMLRSDASGTVGISLFVNDKAVAQSFDAFTHPNSIFEIIYSNPKSPASVTTEVIKAADINLTDTLLGNAFAYSTRSFFQVNIPVYEAALKEISDAVTQSKQKNIIDMYSGVGSIGLSVVGDEKNLTMIEISEESTAQAQINMVGRSNCKVITATAESALEHFTGDEIIILDPPRAGLHNDVTEKLIEVKPQTIIYLSCNPSTQARDVALLTDAGYKITHARGYNFFPRTPHIESLIVLNKV
jgi:23S rRNA (uracil1939-C5)-methyltransferase